MDRRPTTADSRVRELCRDALLEPPRQATPLGGRRAVLALALCLGSGSPPSVVGPGVVSTALVESGGAIDPVDGSLYFVRTDRPWGERGCGTILRSEPVGGQWAEPEPVFGGDACYSDPFISADGARLYLTSTAHTDPARTDDDIWVARRSGAGWQRPEPLAGVNSPHDESSPVEVADGSVYFSSTRPGGLGQGDVWRAERTSTGLATPVPLGRPINSPRGEWNLLVAADESWIIFEASGRPEGLSPSGDLYVSWRIGEGWSEPAALPAVNTTGSDLMPRLSPDGVTLLFASSRAAHSRNVDLFMLPLAEALAGIVRPVER